MIRSKNKLIISTSSSTKCMQGCQKYLAVSENCHLLGYSNGRLLCLAFLYVWRFLNRIPPDWPLTLTTQLSTSKLSDNPGMEMRMENLYVNIGH